MINLTITEEEYFELSNALDNRRAEIQLRLDNLRDELKWKTGAAYARTTESIEIDKQNLATVEALRRKAIRSFES